MMRSFLPLLIFCSALSARGDETCERIGRKLGQLFYVNVDGFGDFGPTGISDAYYPLVKDLQVGGVLPKYSTNDPTRMRAANARLQAQTELPLLIGIDYARVQGGRIGMGWKRGFVSEYGRLPPNCQADLAFLHAIAERSIGLNHALGPTVENNHRWPNMDRPPEEMAAAVVPLLEVFRSAGVVTTLKHFPFTPDSFDLHETNSDQRLSPAALDTKLENFRRLAPHAEIVMSTHIYDSGIDSAELVTFSKIWVEKLRRDVGFRGLLMTDGLFMMKNYPDTVAKMLATGTPGLGGKIADLPSIFATRAILAGHDLVILDGTAAETRKVFRDLRGLACQTSTIGRELARRIDESYARIVAFKREHSAQLRGAFSGDPALAREAAEILRGTRPPEAPEFRCPDAERLLQFRSHALIAPVTPRR